VRIEVWDRADGVPSPQDADANAVSGRGLPMVAYFSSARWGWTTHNAHGWKSVHAVLGPDPVKEPGNGSIESRCGGGTCVHRSLRWEGVIR